MATLFDNTPKTPTPGSTFTDIEQEPLVESPAQKSGTPALSHTQYGVDTGMAPPTAGAAPAAAPSTSPAKPLAKAPNLDTEMGKKAEETTNARISTSTRHRYTPSPTPEIEGRAIEAQRQQLTGQYEDALRWRQREYNTYVEQHNAIIDDPNASIEDLDALNADWRVRSGELRELVYASQDALIEFNRSSDAVGYADRKAEYKRENDALAEVHSALQDKELKAELLTEYTQDGAFIRKPVLMAISSKYGVDVNVVAGMARHLLNSGGDAMPAVVEQAAKMADYGDLPVFMASFNTLNAQMGGTLSPEVAQVQYEALRQQHVYDKGQRLSYGTRGNTVITMASFLGMGKYMVHQIDAAVAQAKKGDPEALEDFEQRITSQYATKIYQVAQDMGNTSVSFKVAETLAGKVRDGQDAFEVMSAMIPVTDTSAQGQKDRLGAVSIFLSGLGTDKNTVEDFAEYVEKKSATVDISTNVGLLNTLKNFGTTRDRVNPAAVKEFVSSRVNTQASASTFKESLINTVLDLNTVLEQSTRPTLWLGPGGIEPGGRGTLVRGNVSKARVDAIVRLHHVATALGQLKDRIEDSESSVSKALEGLGTTDGMQVMFKGSPTEYRNRVLAYVDALEASYRTALARIEANPKFQPEVTRAAESILQQTEEQNTGE